MLATFSLSVARDAFLHPRKLFGCCLTLMARLPFLGRHAVDERACDFAIGRAAGLNQPVGQAVAAETGQSHEVDILRVAAVAQMTDKPPECSRRGTIIDFVEAGGP